MRGNSSTRGQKKFLPSLQYYLTKQEKNQQRREVLTFFERRKSPRDKIAEEKFLKKEKSLTKIIAEEIKASITKEKELENIEKWESKVAPNDKIIADIAHTLGSGNIMFADKKLKTALSIRAVEGHAQNGHGMFKTAIEPINENESKRTEYIPNPYPNTTTTRVLRTIEKDGKSMSKDFSEKKFKELSQSYINQTVLFFEDWLKEIEYGISSLKSFPESKKMSNNRTKAMHGMQCNKGLKIDMLEGLRGFYLTTMMDSLEATRSPGAEIYGYHPGGGEGYLANTENIKKYGIDVKDLAKMQNVGILKKLERLHYEEKIEILQKLKIIENKKLPLEDIAEGEYTWGKILSHKATTDLIKEKEKEEVFLRKIFGEGIRDDGVIFLSAFLSSSIYNKGHKLSSIAPQSRMTASIWGDATDTHCKTAQIFLPGGQDYIAGLHLNGLYKKLARNPKFRELFNIKERSDNDYNLIERRELIDFTMAGVNIPGEHLHSSQRHMYIEIPKDEERNIPPTCTISEYMKYMTHCAIAENMEIDTINMRNYKVDLSKPLTSKKITFGRIPFENVRKMMKERLNLVIDPEKREERLGEYFSRIQDRPSPTIH